MPTIERTTTGMISPSSGDIQTRINNLRSSFASGNTIQQSHFSDLISAFYVFNDHYHNVDNDLYGIHDVGNTDPPGYGGGAYTGAKSTSRMYSADGTQGFDTGIANFWEPGIPSVGDTITAAKHQELKRMFENANNHYHQIDDRTS